MRWHCRCYADRMVEKLQDLRVHQSAVGYWNAVYRLFSRPGFRRDHKLREQVESANDSIKANISEGFEQGSDAGFIRYLEYSKGSLAEVMSRLNDACQKGYISDAELRSFAARAESLGNSIGRLIQYLDSCGWKDRGRHKSRARALEKNAAAESPNPHLPTGPPRTPWLPSEDAPADPATSD